MCVCNLWVDFCLQIYVDEKYCLHLKWFMKQCKMDFASVMCNGYFDMVDNM